MIIIKLYQKMIVIVSKLKMITPVTFLASNPQDIAKTELTNLFKGSKTKALISL